MLDATCFCFAVGAFFTGFGLGLGVVGLEDEVDGSGSKPAVETKLYQQM